LVAFALSPVHKFKFLLRWNLITEPKRKELDERAKAALSIVARGLNSVGTNYNTLSSTLEGLVDDSDDDETDESTLDPALETEFKTLRKNKEFKTLMGKLEHPSKVINPKEKRNELMALLWQLTESLPFSRMLLKIFAGFSLSTVECERDFSWLQHLLQDKRISLSSSMAVASLLARKCSRFFSFEGQSVAVKPNQILVDLVNGDTRPKKKQKRISVSKRLVELEDSDWGSDVEVEVNSRLPVEDSLSVTSSQPTSLALIADPHNNIEVHAENTRFRRGPSRRAKKHQDPRVALFIQYERGIIESTECLKESNYFLEHGVFPESSSLSEANTQEDEESSEQPETSEEEEIEEEEEDKSE